MTRLNIMLCGGLLGIYFLFTSGVMFEVTKSEVIDRVDIPYSAISAERTGVIGLYTENDVECAKWLAENRNPLYRIYADINGQLLLSGWVEPYTQIQEVFAGKLKFKEPYYFFLTEWNVEHRKMVWHTGLAGLRKYGEIPEILRDKEVIHERGKTRIYRAY